MRSLDLALSHLATMLRTALPAPKRIGYRSDSKRWMPLAMMREMEVEDRGNDWFDDSHLDEKTTEVIWVCHTKKDALRYGDADNIYQVDLTGAIIRLDDGDKGFLYSRLKR